MQQRSGFPRWTTAQQGWMWQPAEPLWSAFAPAWMPPVAPKWWVDWGDSEASAAYRQASRTPSWWQGVMGLAPSWS